MKKLIGGLCIVAVVLFSMAAKSPDKVVIANGEWAPYFAESFEHYGVVSRVVKESFELEGVTVEYVFHPWKRGMEEAKTGKINATMGYGKKAERLEFFDYSSTPIMENTNVIFHRVDKPIQWNTVSDLAAYKLGGTVGYFYGKELEEAEKAGTIKIERGRDEKLVFKKLFAGRIDGLPSDLDAGYHIINDLLTPEEAKQLTNHSKKLDTFPCYLLLGKTRPENKELMELFEKGFKKLRDSGKVDQYWKESREGKYKK